jgi:hypothetical protein
MIPVLVLMIAAAPQTQAEASPQDTSAVKAAADHFALDLPAEQDPPPEVHLNAPDARAAPVESVTDARAPATDNGSPPAAEAPLAPSADAVMPAPPETASPSLPASPPQDEGDPSKVDAAPIAGTAIPASDVALPADNAAAPAGDAKTAPDASATPPGDAAPASQPSPDAVVGADKNAPAAAGTDTPAPAPSAAAPETSAPADNNSNSNPSPDKAMRSDTAVDPDPTGTPALHAGFTLDTPIAELVADPRARAVLDKDLPGLSDDPNLAKFSALSLRKFQPLTGGQLTDKLLQQTANDLVLAASGNAPSSPNDLNPTAMPAPKTSGHDRFSDGR